MRLNTVTASVCLAAAGIGAPAAAHDIWVVPQEKAGAAVAHVRYADPGKLELAERGKIVSLAVIWPGGRINLRRPLTPTSSGPLALESKPFKAPAGSILEVVYDNGFWTVSAEDGVEPNSSKLLVPDGKESWWVPKFGKTLLGPGSYSVRTNAILEIVPLEDPYATAVGGVLRVRLVHRGRPVAGVPIVYGDGVEPIPEDKMPSVKTGRDGVALIPINRKGAYLLAAHQETAPTVRALADKDDVYATLAFDTSR